MNPLKTIPSIRDHRSRPRGPLPHDHPVAGHRSRGRQGGASGHITLDATPVTATILTQGEAVEVAEAILVAAR